ncbi:hypothetical protein J5N97_013438 [Dioscorea zingiberensis]|uniref:Uncharacterized protein n=1 Tax=Dioscorea zingiberensis TaxID=325984 RepID=A0A9D5CRV7_9LILI|nr:hypothetical protein J5N97_013438 [Dioscorea zingiberensis]
MEKRRPRPGAKSRRLLAVRKEDSKVFEGDISERDVKEMKKVKEKQEVIKKHIIRLSVVHRAPIFFATQDAFSLVLPTECRK